MRLAQSQANSQYNTATNNAGRYGAAASTVGTPLTSFLLNRLNTPTGYSQNDLTAMLSRTLGSSGGATSGITGQAEQQVARTRNGAGVPEALAEAARTAAKTNAGAAEGIAGENAQLKQQQQSDAARALQGLYGTDVNAQADQQGLADKSINTELEAGKSGWLQNLTGLLGTIGSLGTGVGAAFTGWGRRNG